MSLVEVDHVLQCVVEVSPFGGSNVSDVVSESARIDNADHSNMMDYPGR